MTPLGHAPWEYGIGSCRAEFDEPRALGTVLYSITRDDLLLARADHAINSGSCAAGLKINTNKQKKKTERLMFKTHVFLF